MTSLLRATRELLSYTMWANRLQLAACEQVDPADLVRDTGSSHGSLLGTLAHILGAERLWLSRLLGNPLPDLPGDDLYPDVGALRAGFEELWAELEFFLASLQDDVLSVELGWTDERGAAHTQATWQVVLHLVNHDTWHRGQIATMLRQLGYQPVGCDLVTFFASR